MFAQPPVARTAANSTAAPESLWFGAYSASDLMTIILSIRMSSIV